MLWFRYIIKISLEEGFYELSNEKQKVSVYFINLQ